MEYLFTGKLTLFPLTILFLGVGAGVLLLQGNKPYLHGYFESNEVYYGITGKTNECNHISMFTLSYSIRNAVGNVSDRLLSGFDVVYSVENIIFSQRRGTCN